MKEDSRWLTEVTRRRVLGGVATFGAASAATGAGTVAFFQDTETSSGNTIKVGTLDLAVRDGEDTGPDVSGVYSISNAKPTDSVAARIQLSNQGTLEADHVELAFSVKRDEADGNGHDEGDTYDGAAGMAEQFEVTHLSYPKDGSFVSKDDVADINGNGIPDLADLAAQGLDDLDAPDTGGAWSETFGMEFEWRDSSALDVSFDRPNNAYQGDELEITVTMYLHQESSQDTN